MRENNEQFAKKKLTRTQRKELKAAGVKVFDKALWRLILPSSRDLRMRQRRQAEAAASAASAEAERLAREANPSTEDLLKLILAEPRNK